MQEARAAWASTFGGAGSRAAHGTEVGCAAAMGHMLCCMAATTPFRRTRGGVTVPALESVFGPALLRTGLWALKQNYSSSDALQT